MTTTTALSIAEAADRTGLTAHTRRYYERIGLLDPVERDGTGHRRFGEDDLTRVAFLQKLRRTGMPIQQMRTYVELLRGGPATDADRLALLEAHRDRVVAELAELQECLSFIDYKIDRYRRSTT
jgi:DNA-binding transcriptional MerR regulator